MADLNKPAFYPRVGNITPKPRAPLAQTEVREQPLDPIMRVFKDLMDRSSELLDKSQATPFDVTKGLVSAIPFQGERLAKDFEKSTMPVPTGFGLLPKASPQGLDTSEMGVQSVRVPTKDALEQMKWSDLVGTAGASRMFEALGQNRTPEFFDTLDAATLGLGGMSAAKNVPKAAKVVGEGAKAAGMGGLELINRGMFGEGPLANFVPQHQFVIKPKGGNWLTGGVEDALKGLKRDTMMGAPGDTVEDVLKKKEALNNWVDRNLTNYVKKEMATPEDPVRKLAEEGITHMPKNEIDFHTQWIPEDLALSRMNAGFPSSGVGKSNTAKGWEAISDSYIHSAPASEYTKPLTDFEVRRGLKSLVDDNPWLAKIDPEARVGYLKSPGSVSQDLGFDHILDVLRQDVAEGRIRPEQLNKVSMEQAVRRTYEYDQEMAKRMHEATLKQQEGFPVHKEYPEGYKWLELAMPKPSENLPQGWTMLEPKGGVMRAVNEAGDRVIGNDMPELIKNLYYRHPDTPGNPRQMLEEALKYEGNTMGHCVGGYCPDVVEGRTRIFSLRDPKGEPHVTVEVRPTRGQNKYQTDWFAKQPEEIQDKITEQALAEHNLMAGNRTPQDDRFTWGQAFSNAIKSHMGEVPDEIIQIKGKQNAKPKDEYLPYVQDFVKGGNWSTVGDFHNTGLTERGAVFTPTEVQRFIDLGQDVPMYLSKEDIAKLRQARGDAPPAEGMKRGGVAISKNPDTMMLELGERKMAGGGALAKLVRAAPKTASEIEAIAQRMAPQMLGEFVRGEKGTQSVAGKTQKQFAKEKEMVHDIRPTGAERPLPKTVDIEKLKDQVMIGIPGDPTISGQSVHSVAGVPLESPSPQHGGPLYGLGRDDAFWASGLGAANRVQNLAREASQQYDLPVLGKYIMMGPESINYAQHFADANLSAIDPSKMTKAQIEGFNKLIRHGSAKSGPRPSFPGIENPAEAYLHFSVDPELRKHFNALMQMPTVIEKHGLPSGIDVRHAITEPDLRDLEVGVTGKSIGRLRPEAKDLNWSEHPTYSHDIPGEFMGSSKYPIPYELSFPDTIKSVRENPKQAPQEFGSLKMVGPRQVIDQQLIDEIKQYEEQIKKLTGKKKGGTVHKAAGGAITGDDLIIEERPL